MNRKICLKEPVVHRMSIENAEIAKIALNSYVTMKISFANTLADLCERIPGGDVDVVSDAIGSDTRIGRKYLTGGLGFGGPCFPRDNVALGFLCEHVGADGNLLVANHGYNKSMATRIATKIAPLLQVGQPQRCWACRISLSPTSSRNLRASPWPWPWRKQACE